MNITSPARTWLHTSIRLDTSRPFEFVPLTDRLSALVAGTGVDVGLVNVQTRHTTTAIVTNEHEPLLLGDFEAALERVAGRLADYSHDDLTRRRDVPPDEPRNGCAHCRALLLPTSVCLNIVNGRLALGRWQQVFLLELDGPRPREISVVVFGDAER